MTKCLKLATDFIHLSSFYSVHSNAYNNGWNVGIFSLIFQYNNRIKNNLWNIYESMSANNVIETSIIL